MSLRGTKRENAEADVGSLEQTHPDLEQLVVVCTNL